MELFIDSFFSFYWVINIHILLIYFIGASSLQLVMEQDAERRRLISHASSLKSVLILIMSSTPSSMKREHHSIRSPQRHGLSFLAWTPIISVLVSCGRFFCCYISLLVSFPFYHSVVVFITLSSAILSGIKSVRQTTIFYVVFICEGKMKINLFFVVSCFTVSLARRLQDPLLEYIKVHPMHMGVGMYQHDIPERILHASLDSVMTECVSFVGVDINSASEFVLRSVPENFMMVLYLLMYYDVCFALLTVLHSDFNSDHLCRGFGYFLFINDVGKTS